MAEGTINAYDLSDSGVNVDAAQIHKADGDLTKAQNATTDPTGVGGGIRKRPGLVEFNAVAGAGSMLGGIGAPLQLLTNVVGGTTLAGGPTRKIFWGRCEISGTQGASAGWWTSTDKFATAAVAILAGTPANPRSDQLANFETSIGATFTGMPNSCAVIKNCLFYPADDYTKAVTAPALRMFDGVVDMEVTRIPLDITVPSGVACYGVLSMLPVGDVIYMTVLDATPAIVNPTGRVLAFNTTTGALTMVGSSFPTSHLAYCLEWHAGQLWCGTFWRTDDSNAGRIYKIRPGIEAAWTLDRTMAVGKGCMTLNSYKGVLYAGSMSITTGANTRIEARDSLGAWASSLNVGGSSYSAFLNGVVFKDNLYVSLYLNSTASTQTTIRKFDGTTWTTAYTDPSGNDAPYPMAFQTDGTVYFGGGGDAKGQILVSSTDGTTWTVLTTSLTAHNGLPMIGALAI